VAENDPPGLGNHVKICSLCRIPRPDHEPVCAICDNDEFTAAGNGAYTGIECRYLMDNRLDLAYNSLEADVAGGDEDERRTLWLAWLAYAFDDLPAVETWWHEAVRLNPDSPEPHLLLGLVRMRGEHWSEAVEEFDAGLKKPGISLDRQAVLETFRANAIANIPEW